MSDERVLEIWLGDPHYDWCDTCLLPSNLVFSLHTANDEGIGVLGTGSKCDGCAES